jgi:hypothetical protein
MSGVKEIIQHKEVIQIMKVVNKIDSFTKLTKSEQNAINTGISRLKERVDTYVKYGHSLDERFMDDKLIHDAYTCNGRRFFLYKCRIKTTSLRLLYTVEGKNIIVISHVIKKNSRYEYFNYFENACEEYMHSLHNKKDKVSVITQ